MTLNLKDFASYLRFNLLDNKTKKTGCIIQTRQISEFQDTLPMERDRFCVNQRDCNIRVALKMRGVLLGQTSGGSSPILCPGEQQQEKVLGRNLTCSQLGIPFLPPLPAPQNSLFVLRCSETCLLMPFTIYFLRTCYP